MRCFTNIYRKALFRQPIRMLLLVLILAAACFAFTSHAAEAILVAQKTDMLEEYYSPIGYLTGKWDVRAGQEIISECPYLELEDIRLYSDGRLIDMQNPDVDGISLEAAFYKHTNESVFVGRLEGSKFEKNPKGSGGYYELDFRVQSVEASYEDYMSEGSLVHIRSLPEIETKGRIDRGYYPLKQDEVFLKEYENLEEGKDYLIRGYYYESFGMNGIWAASQGRAGSTLILLPLLPTGGVLPEGSYYFYEVSGEAEDSKPELAELFDYAEYLNHNQSMMNVNGTKNMSRMPEFQEASKKYYMVEGRILTEEDDAEERRVCVIHEKFAKLRGLQLGDTLSVKLEKEQGMEHWAGYTLWENWEEWKEKIGGNGIEAKLEIVGIYNDLYYPYLSMYGTRMFVPASCLSPGYGRDLLESGGEGSYSFVLQNPDDQERFLEEYGKRLEEAGYQIIFVENNAENFLKTAGELKRSMLFGTVLFGIVLAVLLVAACSLYLSQRKKEYAIARALGLPAGRAVLGMSLSFGWVLLPGILLGGVLGWQKMLRDAGTVLASLTGVASTEISPEEVLEEEAAAVSTIAGQTVGEPEVSLSIGWFFLIVAAILLASVLLFLFYSLVLARKPVLSLLQGTTRARQGTGRRAALENGEEEQAREKEQKTQDLGLDRGVPFQTAANRLPVRRNILAARTRYLKRHILRTRAKSLLLVGMGIGLVLLVGWMRETMSSYQKEIEILYQNTMVEGEIKKIDSSVSLNGREGGGFIPPEIVAKLTETGLFSEIYVEESAWATDAWLTDETGRPQEAEKPALVDIPLIGIYDWESFLEKTGSQLEVQFYQGYNGSHFTREREKKDKGACEVLIPEGYMQMLGLHAGDGVLLCHQLSNETVSKGVYYRIVGSYQVTMGGTGTEMNNLGAAFIMQGTALQELVGEDYYYQKAQFVFDSKQNRKLLEREEELKNIVSGEQGYSFLRLFIWDEELHKVVEPLERTVSLFGILYPVAVVVSLAIGVGFQILLLLHRWKEAATMRVLGSSVRSVGLQLGAEQLLVCLAGVLLGLFLGWLRYKGLEEGIWIAVGVYFLGNLVGILTGCVAVARRSPLALLQEKE